MYEFNIQNMTCGHCAGAVEKAIKSADPAAQAQVDLTSRTAKVQTGIDPVTVAAAIEKAGYPNTFKTL
ncbi:heavy metal-associated domain-containing protein [Rhizobium sp. R693]|uniref:heavy-metal-associated domain-containing protein n=1 Tax=Rhizobium sp. R693 TaxID=1764276 RepID=UPI000B535E5B|nr:heavy metal-associated domain-containing protein [Rhizobium sp. R693]OWV96852.1 heavy metal-binding protein [Rhizobium sp. R693]